MDALMASREFSFMTDYSACRKRSTDLCSHVEIEDLVVQPTPEVSPIKWHLAHTTWFFEELILAKHLKGYVRYNERYGELFNSYYNALGPHWIQSGRGTQSRPTVSEIIKYRNHVDKCIEILLNTSDINGEVYFLMELGINHEEQHQELMLMDIKYILSRNAVRANYYEGPIPTSKRSIQGWRRFGEGVYFVGNESPEFSFDNENPRHKTYLYPFEISSSLVTNGEYLEFLNSRAYSNPRFWLSLGWEWVQKNQIRNPLYWIRQEGAWLEFTLHGVRPIDLNSPVVHVSYFEADAFARWKDMRLPTEQEFEVFLGSESWPAVECEGTILHPVDPNAVRRQVWCWTKSPYVSYPNFESFQGALEEYNGKFMCNQFVLKGGCFATPEGHYRDSYRNFYLPEQRWIFSGIRLAKDPK
jgi:ergothioneine biosynthesis protein EgtB